MIASEIRPCIAAIALAHTHNQAITQIYDYASDVHVNIALTVYGKVVSGTDANRLSKLTGELPDVFDHARGSYIHITGENGQYSGFDHQSQTHFTIEVRDKTAALYDHDAKSWSQYSL